MLQSLELQSAIAVSELTKELTKVIREIAFIFPIIVSTEETLYFAQISLKNSLQQIFRLGITHLGEKS